MEVRPGEVGCLPRTPGKEATRKCHCETLQLFLKRTTKLDFCPFSGPFASTGKAPPVGKMEIGTTLSPTSKEALVAILPDFLRPLIRPFADAFTRPTFKRFTIL